MSVEEIKRGIAALSPKEQSDVTAYLYHLRHFADSHSHQSVSSRLSDSDLNNWLAPEKLETQLEQA